MNLASVMDEVGQQLGTITGLRVTPHPAATVVAPAAIVSMPQEVQFDQPETRVTLPVLILVGRPTDRRARDRVLAYCDETGAASVKAVLEAHTFTSCDTVFVAQFVCDVVSVAGVEYLAVTFAVEITG